MWTASNYTCSILLMSSSGDRSSPLSILALVWFTQAFSSSVSLSLVSDSYGTGKKHHQDKIKTVDSFKVDPLLLLHRCTVYCVCLYPSVSHLVKWRQMHHCAFQSLKTTLQVYVTTEKSSGVNMRWGTCFVVLNWRPNDWKCLHKT